jgi:hypothetical protein
MSIELDTITKAEKELKQLEDKYKELAADAALTAASFAPPPFGTAADVVSIGKSLWSGDWGGALLDVVGLIPIVGDTIKGATKGTKIAAKMDEVQDAIKAARETLTKKKNNLLNGSKTNQAGVDKAKNNSSITCCGAKKQRPLPQGGQPIEKRLQDGGNPPEHVRKNPDKYYYNPETGKYPRRPEPKPNFSDGTERKIPCFPKGTPVATSTGTVPIENLTVGTNVLAFDEFSQTQVQKPITALMHNRTINLVDIMVGTETLQATLSHRFWIENKKQWIAAQYLEPTMYLRTLTGKVENIKQILVREVSEQETYNLSIADYHTYFVGNEGFLVHNADEKPNGKIYVGRDPKTGEVIYVGQTKQDLSERAKQHGNDAKKYPEKYGFKKGMVFEEVMDGLTDDEMDYHERRIYDEHGGKENIKENKILKNRQLPMTTEKINALKAKHCK